MRYDLGVRENLYLIKFKDIKLINKRTEFILNVAINWNLHYKRYNFLHLLIQN